ncbi:hypothetical protein [Xanthomonas sp. NCPPB 2632]|uniref:hypothetical protein n=1 Tax=Xanthomonas sp. NCPPB 2632 TaxID=3240912 RepID=UPI0035160E9E
MNTRTCTAKDHVFSVFPLHVAAGNGDLDTVRQLLAVGFDPNGLMPGRLSPLHFACARHASESAARGHSFASRQTRVVIDELIRAGGKLLVMDQFGRLPMSLLDGYTWPELQAHVTAAMATAAVCCLDHDSGTWVKPRDCKDRHKLIKDQAHARGHERKKSSTSKARVPAVESPAVAAFA